MSYIDRIMARKRLFMSFEDSSSISSGISENFDDVSTDDLSGTCICRMTLGCEGNFVDAQMSSPDFILVL
ncbi:hypothetical protein TELCIR_13946 [Teladorsagia circumcincta]|uniref:Uncharacterized protein n=1 Tax=Teladorsagia circumcincta TaxID=45464 RepID=A0A2G9U2F2_TELCI|nr:hypothetical protein TELCIR_13946 [Teladorsagia circumcincta]